MKPALDKALRGVELRLDDTGVIRKALEEGQIVYSQGDGLNQSLRERGVDLPGRYAVVPLIIMDNKLGVVIVDNSYTEQPLEANIILLQRFAYKAAIAEQAATYNRMRQEIERLAAIRQMEGEVAHEIRNPLAEIGGWVTTLVKKLDAGDIEKVKECAIGALTGVKSAERILTDYDGSVKTGEPNYMPVRLDILLSDILEVQNQQENGVTYTSNLNETPEINADPDQLNQAFTTLLGYAHQRIGSGSIEVTSDVKEKGVKIEIKGIPEGELKKARYDSRMSGSGLAESRNIIKGNNGSVKGEEIEGNLVFELFFHFQQ